METTISGLGFRVYSVLHKSTYSHLHVSPSPLGASYFTAPIPQISQRSSNSLYTIHPVFGVKEVKGIDMDLWEAQLKPQPDNWRQSFPAAPPHKSPKKWPEPWNRHVRFALVAQLSCANCLNFRLNSKNKKTYSLCC